MKRNTLIVAAIAFAATTAAIGSAVASLLPTVVAADVYVRKNEASAPTVSVPLIFAGNQAITPAPGVDLTVNIDDRRTSGADTRKGRDNGDIVIQTATATTVNSNVVILN